jgi:hypothetical protein
MIPQTVSAAKARMLASLVRIFNRLSIFDLCEKLIAEALSGTFLPIVNEAMRDPGDADAAVHGERYLLRFARYSK